MLQQTLLSLEIVVVVDGPDDATLAVLDDVKDARLRWIILPGKSGGSSARNAGVEAAVSEWIAFLDDDDEWLPQKLEAQMKAALASSVLFPVVSTKIIVRSQEGDLHWPRRIPSVGEPISEYLFCRSGFFSGDGQFLTSAIFARRQLLLLCPFNAQVGKHDDTEWYLTVAFRNDTTFIIVPEPLTVWHQGSSTSRVSKSGDWRSSLAWAQTCHRLMTPKAYASFVLNAVAAEAAETHDLRGIATSYFEAFRSGKPRAFDLLFPVMLILFPRELRQKLRLIRESLRQVSGRRRLQAPMTSGISQTK